MNRRTDAYGGSDERRMRLALDIIIAIRPACGASMLVMYRHSPVGAGYGIEDSVAFAERLVGAGVDILDLSPSSERQPGDRSEPFRELGAAVITVNGNAAALAARELGDLARATGALVEINLFHRSEERLRKVCDLVEKEMGMKVLGREQDAVLEFETEIDGIHVNGVDMITWNEQGQISDFKVMLRPLKAINVVQQRMAELLQQLT